ncbi:flagellar biosynthesis regulator FlaF [Acetobacter fallax]|uniref:FlaF protein n=1 Tax=Acetobacter fallax TaxID=1737473 RepID=A0ABX0KHH8_9PROT|nr:flagellar biosynthesis regulator FlaF [Acetobacter fallax]NHO34468.1 hypothetical protein [Acetobacter fallax]NHO38027.1 hypothetical protein [Acetobacter fallax]
MSYGIQRYNKNTSQTMTPRQIEELAFRQANALMKTANDEKSRLHALDMNQKLWSAILRETGIENNDMPAILRQDLRKLAVWATRYSIQAMLHGIALKPLIDINQDMLDGLRETIVATTPTAGSENPSPFSFVSA